MSDTLAIPTPNTVDLRLPAVVLVALSLLFMLAWNWHQAPRFLLFSLLQGAFGVACIAACCLPGARISAGLLAFVGIGVMLGYFGQTYQTGVSEWRLLGAWALLGLPLCLVVRHVVVWNIWAILAMSAIGWWLASQLSVAGSWWPPEDLFDYLIAWGLGLTILVAASGPWALGLRIQATTRRILVVLYLALVITSTAHHSFRGEVPILYWCAIATVALALVCCVCAREPVATCITLLALIVLVELTTMRSYNSGGFFGEWSGYGPGSLVAAVLLVICTWTGIRVLKYPATTVAKVMSMGIWFVMLPLSFLLALYLIDTVKWHGYLIFGASGIVISLAALVRFHHRIYVSQAWIGVLFLGFLMVAFEVLFREQRYGWTIMVAVSLLLSVCSPVQWLRCTLVMLATLCFGQAYVGAEVLTIHLNKGVQYWESWQIVAALWFLMTVAGWHKDSVEKYVATRCHSIWLGVGIFLAFGMAATAAVIFFKDITTLGWLDSLLNDFADLKTGEIAESTPAMQMISFGEALLGVGWLASRQQWRHNYAAMSAAVALAGLALINVHFGVLVLLSTVAITTSSRNVLLVATVAAVWVLWSSYFEPAPPFSLKTITLLAIGLYCASLHWRARKSTARKYEPPVDWRPMTALAVLMLTSFNVAIWQKQAIITYGRTIFLQVAQYDPRSLMQGDYLAVDFSLPFRREGESGDLDRNKLPPVAVVLDERGIPSSARWVDAVPSTPGEQLIKVSWRDSQIIIGSNAWFFQEGQAERWENAAFGEFRVLPNGEILLVGLRDGELKPL